MRFWPLFTLLLVGCPTKEEDDTSEGEETGEEDDTAGADTVGECETTEPCGGDAVGDWTIATACIPDFNFTAPEECPTATAAVSNLALPGTVSINADGTYLLTTEGMSMDLTLHIPASCIEGLTCADLGTYMEADCVDATDGCDCTSQQSGEGDTETGTWVAADTTVTLTNADGEVETVDYCADSDEMWLSITPEEQGAPAFSLLLTK